MPGTRLDLLRFRKLSPVCIDNQRRSANNARHLVLPPAHRYRPEALMFHPLKRFCFFTLLAITLSTLGPIDVANAAPQQEELERLEQKMEEINKAPIPEEHKQKAREHIQREMEKIRNRGGGEKKGDGRDGKKPEKKDGEKDKKEEEKSTTVKRPEEPKQPADRRELLVEPVDGKLKLQFRGHPWPDMIDWYSRVTGIEVEWQELPSGFLNVRTQRELTMPEIGDLLNRMLLARGFTMLDDGGFFQIIKTENINPAFVPRVEPKRLATMMPHSFARTSFQLHRFKADEIVKELEAMKSPQGKLSAMTAANRIEAMDTVRNLREIYRVVDEEQSSGVHKPREFVIRYVRADLIREKLEEMLGIQGSGSTDSSSGGGRKGRQEMEMMMMRKRMEMEMKMRQAQQNRGKPGTQEKKEEISIIVNEIKNSLIVKAPPHRMLDISDAIELLDVRQDPNALAIRAYTLATRSPEEVKDMLEESQALSPTAMVRVDEDSKTLLVSGTEFDHFRIEDLIERIDGNARRFVSIQLRKYPAAQVAGTIEKMMGAEEDDNNRRRYYWWDNDDEKEDPNDKFRVTADVEANRLIMKCNDAEYETVMDLLTQMGEVLSRSKFSMNQVVLDDLDTSQEDELLRRVQEAFQQYAPNKVILPSPREEEPEEEATIEEVDEVEEDAVDIGSRTTQIERRHRVMFTQLRVADAVGENRAGDGRSSSEPRARTAPPARTDRKQTEPPPIVIERNSDGKLVIRSEDPRALEMFEELMREMAPRKQDWVSFQMKHVTALWMRYQLEDFFKDDDGGPNYVFWDYWDYQRSQQNKSGPGLGEAPKMRFIDDGESTLVVRNASAKQLATIKRLIELYDVSVAPNENTARYKKVIKIKFGKAREIEASLKDLFRDLLSSNDKAFADQNKGDNEKGGSRRFGWGFGFNDDDEGDSGLGSGSTFKGKLSFGVNESTNILMVTAQGRALLDLVAEIVDDLDQESMPSDSTQVVSLPSGLNRDTIKATLVKMFGPDSVTTRKQGSEEGRPEGGENRGGEGKGRGRGEWRGK